MAAAAADEGPVVVVGAGLTGCMAALLLAQRGERVVLLENRADWREEDRLRAAKAASAPFGQLTDARARSINLALSFRGIAALREAGLLERVRPWLIPMRGRSVHLPSGKVSFQPYGTEEQAIYSVSRRDLNTVLLDAACALPGVEVRFHAKVRAVSAGGAVTLDGQAEPLQASLVLGADGAYSRVRQSLLRHTRADYRQRYISHGYKELTIPPAADGGFALADAESLSIWPRHEFMLIALPNQDRSFTCTLFAPFDGPDSLDSHKGDDEIRSFLERNFPDALPLMPDAVREYKENPSSALVTLELDTFTDGDRLCLLGDAAHAIVPFLGQGMNAGFESALIFAELWDAHAGDRRAVLREFQAGRPPSTRALADLSLANYVEMRSLVAKPWFVLKSSVDAALHRTLGDRWVPKYSMIQFTRMPYHEAVAKAARQDRTLRVAGAAALASAAAAALWFVPAVRQFCKALVPHGVGVQH